MWLNNRRLIGVGLGLLGLVGVAVVIGDRLVINPTASLPRGLYWAAGDRSIERGSFVAVCVGNNEQGRFVKKYSNVTSGSCPDRYGRILKVVRGVPGDAVRFDDTGVWINDRLIPHSQPVEKDRAGLPMPHPTGRVTLRAGEYILMGDHEKSLDSRYLGIFHDRQIQYRLQPLFLIDSEENSK